jgi:glutamyl-tRNA reductase
MKDRSRPVILFVGVNQMIDLAAARLQHVTGVRLQFANRTPRKAAALAAKYDASSFGLEDLSRLIERAHVVVTCTSASDPVITGDMLRAAAAARTEGRAIIMDLAVPRDVEGGAHPADAFDIYTLDDVQRFVEARQHERILAVPQAEEIVAHRADEFNYWYEHVMHEPMYNGSAPAFESLRREEVASIVDALPPHLQRELHSATRRLVRRIIEAADRGQAHGSE